jgi:sugar O-acyltransferase (sialic acid O-acetyltransferase NeuD family)
MNMKPILIFGDGGHARVVRDLIDLSGLYTVHSCITPKNEKDWTKSGVDMGVVAIGDNSIRARVVADIKKQMPNFHFVTLIHPSAAVAKGVEIGEGTVVMAGACINMGSQLGKHVIINTRVVLDHDGMIRDFASLGPGAVCGGHVSLGERSHIGLGASVIHRITIGEHTIIGAGSVVVKNIGDRQIALGTPCRPVRARTDGEKYL